MARMNILHLMHGPGDHESRMAEIVLAGPSRHAGLERSVDPLMAADNQQILETS